MAAWHLLISGRVQGVGFRWSMCAAAIEHGALGWVRNRRDGRVEAVVDGAPQAVAAMLAWAQHGPARGACRERRKAPGNRGRSRHGRRGFRGAADA